MTTSTPSPVLSAELSKKFDQEFPGFIKVGDGGHDNRPYLKQFIALEKEKSRQEGAEAERARLLLALKQKVYIDQRTLKGTHIDWLDVKEVFTPPEATLTKDEVVKLRSCLEEDGVRLKKLVDKISPEATSLQKEAK